MKKKTAVINPVKYLRDNAGRSALWIASASGATEQSVSNWYADKPIARYYRPVLMRLMKREQARIEREQGAA